MVKHACKAQLVRMNFLMESSRIFSHPFYVFLTERHRTPNLAAILLFHRGRRGPRASDSFEDFVSSELKFHKGHEAWISSRTTVHCTWNSSRSEKEDVCWIPIAQRNRFTRGMSSVDKGCAAMAKPSIAITWTFSEIFSSRLPCVSVCSNYVRTKNFVSFTIFMSFCIIFHDYRQCRFFLDIHLRNFV